MTATHPFHCHLCCGVGSVPVHLGWKTHLRVEKQGDVTRLHLLSPPMSTLSCVLLGRVAQGAPGVPSPALCPAREKLAPSLDATWVSSLLPEPGRGSGVSSGQVLVPLHGLEAQAEGCTQVGAHFSCSWNIPALLPGNISVICRYWRTLRIHSLR